MMNYSQSQKDQLFAIDLEIRKAELEEKRALAAKVLAETALKEREMALRETAQAQALAFGSNPLLESPISKTPPEVLRVSGLLIGMPTAELIAIFTGDHDPYYLFRICDNFAFTKQDETGGLVIKGGAITLSGSGRTLLKGFGTDWKIWRNAFRNYMQIVGRFWGETSPGLQNALLDYYSRIDELAEIYTFESVLRLAIEYHVYLAGRGLIRDIASWSIPVEWRDKFLRTPAIASVSGASAKVVRDSRELCKKFNWKDGCPDTNCAHLHECNRCHIKGCMGGIRCKKA
jgi:hypothetical protein